MQPLQEASGGALKDIPGCEKNPRDGGVIAGDPWPLCREACQHSAEARGRIEVAKRDIDSVVRTSKTLHSPLVFV